MNVDLADNVYKLLHEKCVGSMNDDILSTQEGSIEARLLRLFCTSRLLSLAGYGWRVYGGIRGCAVVRVRAFPPGLSERVGVVLQILLLLLASADALRALDPHKQVGQYGHHSWTPERGLPGDAVYQILQSKDGYLWIRTESGLARFDGVRFVPMDAEIGTVPVRAICMSADGDLLIQTSIRTLIYKDGQVSDYRPRVSLSEDDTARQIFESREHELFIGASNSIYRIAKDGTFTNLRGSTGWISTFLLSWRKSLRAYRYLGIWFQNHLVN